MSYTKHRAIIVHGILEDLQSVHDHCKKIFENHLSGSSNLIGSIIPTIITSSGTFLIAPDGSKLGWDTSNSLDAARDEIIEYLHSSTGCEYLYVNFGGDDHMAEIVA